MDARRLTTGQQEQLLRAVRRQRDYLSRLRQRMGAVGWDRHCPVYNAARAAELALLALADALNASRPAEGRGAPRRNEPQVSYAPTTPEQLARLEANRRADMERFPQTYGATRGMR